MAKTMYSTNTSYHKRRQHNSAVKRDYCQMILGEFRFGLNQNPPKSTDPNAPAVYRFSQMPCYRFAESNEPYMKLYNE